MVAVNKCVIDRFIFVKHPIQVILKSPTNDNSVIQAKFPEILLG